MLFFSNVRSRQQETEFTKNTAADQCIPGIYQLYRPNHGQTTGSVLPGPDSNISKHTNSLMKHGRHNSVFCRWKNQNDSSERYPRAKTLMTPTAAA